VAKKNVLEKVPEFVVAFEEVRAKGHFDDVEIKTMSCGLGKGGIRFLDVRLEGYIPSRPEFAQCGVDPFFDANALLAKLRAMKGDIKTVTCEVKREDWQLWNARATRVVGSKGSQVSFSLYVDFRPQSKKKARTPA
jgi:hypothetical protein